MPVRTPHIRSQHPRALHLRGVIVRAWLTGCLIVTGLGATAALLGYESMGDLLMGALP